MMSTSPQRSFELFARILGLILVAGGSWMACSSLVMAFSPPSYAELLMQMDLPPAIRTALEGMQPQGAALARQVVAIFVLQGVLPIVIGFILMRTGGWFRRPAHQGAAAGQRSALRRFFVPRMSLALARIEDEAEGGYRPFTIDG